jgi:hypothetical protein
MSLPIFAWLAAVESHTVSECELVRRSQQLPTRSLPAIRLRGSFTLADDATFVDEQDRSLDKAAFVADWEPLSPW